MPALAASAVNATARPELAAAVTVYVAPPGVAPDGGVYVNVIDCTLTEGVETTNVCCTCAAAW